MKLILALLLSLLCTVHALPTGDDDHSTHERFHETGPFASIRKTTNDLSAGRRFGSSDSRTNVECAGRCAEQMSEKMNRDVPDTKNITSSMLAEHSTETLNKLCNNNDEAKSCLNQCQTSQLKTFMTKVMIISQYMCHDSTYKQNALCLQEVANASRSICDSQSKCGSYKDKVEQYKINRPTGEDGLKDQLKYSCQMMKCGLDCVKPNVIAKCGQTAQNDLQGLGGKYLEFLRYMIGGTGFGQTYPRECDAVTSA